MFLFDLIVEKLAKKMSENGNYSRVNGDIDALKSEVVKLVSEEIEGGHGGQQEKK